MGQLGDGLLFLPLPIGGVDYRRVQHLAGAVHHRHLAAHAVARVQPHGDPPLHRGLHQQGLQVQGEVVDGTLVRLLSEVGADLPLHGGLDQAVIGVVRRRPDKVHAGRAGYHGPAHRHVGGLRVQLHRDLEHPLPLTSVDGQHLVALGPAHRDLEVIVQAVDRVLRLLGRSPGGQHAPAQIQLPQLPADVGVVGDVLGQDVAGPLKGVLRRLHPLVRVQKVQGRLTGVHRRALSGEQPGQGFQPLLPGDGGPGAPLLLIGAVQVLHLRQSGGRSDGVGELLGELALVLDSGGDLPLPGLQVPQVLKAVRQPAQQLVVHGAVELLAVAGDKRDGGTLVDEGHHILYMLRRAFQLPGERLKDGVHAKVSLVQKSLPV